MADYELPKDLTRMQVANSIHSFAMECRNDVESAFMLEAARLLDPPIDTNTVEVRILVRVDVVDSGPVYSAAGWDGGDHASVAETVDDFAGNADHFTDSPRYSWVTARVPKPEPVAEVEGTVEP